MIRNRGGSAALLALVLVAPATADSPIDRVVVRKSELALSLMAGALEVRRYPIYLGRNPAGPKTRRGDRKTPEGSYLLTSRNPRNRFFRSIRISYPNATDQYRAHKGGWSTGGDITIHGLPELRLRSTLMFSGHYWTDGCIAVSNPHMREIWELVDPETPIDIYP